MNEHIYIIIEALEDYRNWFTDQLCGEKDELEDDRLKVEKINNALEYLQKMLNN